MHFQHKYDTSILLTWHTYGNMHVCFCNIVYAPQTLKIYAIFRSGSTGRQTQSPQGPSNLNFRITLAALVSSVSLLLSSTFPVTSESSPYSLHFYFYRVYY